MTRIACLCLATGLLPQAANAEPIADQYIVVLKDAAPQATADQRDVEATIDRIARVHGATVGHRYGAALRGFSAHMTAAQARVLANDPDVELVEQDQVIHVTSIQSNATWGLDRIDQTALPLDSKYVGLGDGAGATVYVIDTGTRLTHSEFTGRLLPGYSVIADGNQTNDCNGHGTHVMATIGGTTYGIAKKASLVPVRVFDCTGTGTNSNVVAGLNWVIQNKRPLSVANMSLAGGGSDAVDTAVRNLVNAGVPTIVAAGNDNLDACTMSPARAPEAITVGATTSSDARLSYSNFGTCVKIHAPGTYITSAANTGDTATEMRSGTSMASPHVAGVAALYRALNPNATAAQVRQALLAGATPNKVTDAKGSPNLLLASAFLDQTMPTVAITSPANGATVQPTFTVDTMIVEVNMAKADLAIDGAFASSVFAAPFTFEVRNLPAGSHTLTITATDLTAKASLQTITVTVAAGGGSGGDNSDDSNNYGDNISGGCSATGAGTAPGLVLIAVALLLLLQRSRAKRTARSS